MWHSADKHVPAETFRVGVNIHEETQAVVSPTESENAYHAAFLKETQLVSSFPAGGVAHPSVGHADDPGVAAAHQEDEAKQRDVPSARHKTGVYQSKRKGETHQNRAAASRRSGSVHLFEESAKVPAHNQR